MANALLNPIPKLIECPRDAMQGWKRFIPTEEKILYLNALLRVGFDTLDFGSFVSPRVIPQMADTKTVLENLRLSPTGTKLLAIIANVRGAEEAAQYDSISYLGYPFSISETFQLRNTRQTMSTSLDTVGRIQQICLQSHVQMVVYISMGFGNPYGDPYGVEIVQTWVQKIYDLGVRKISLADTVGVAEPQIIGDLFSRLIPAFPEVEFGAHFHSNPQQWEEKLEAAFGHGCRRFDSALGGLGGCPMAKDELVGNIATENLLYFLEKQKVPVSIDREAFLTAQRMAKKIFIRLYNSGQKSSPPASL